MKKPGHQWETRQHRAVRADRPPGPGWEGDSRAETFDLLFAGDVRDVATLGLQRQVVGPTAAADPDVVHAVGCWLAARGQRRIALCDTLGRELRVGSFDVADLGDAVHAPTGPVVTLCPSNLELVVALGMVSRVGACEDSSDWPADVPPVERLGPDLGPDLDRVAQLAPAVVVSSLSVPGMERNVTGLRARGVPQVVCAPRSVDDVLADAGRVGRTLGAERAANELVARLVAERRALADARPPGDPVRVYLEWWPRPMYTPGRDCYSNELVALAGGVNVFSDLDGSSVEVGVDDLVRSDPEVAFVSWCGVAEHKLDPARLVGRPGLEAVSAVRHRRVHRLDERFAGRPGPHMLEAARRMARAIAAVRGPHAGPEAVRANSAD